MNRSKPTTHHPKYKAVILTKEEFQILVDSVGDLAHHSLGEKDILKILGKIRSQIRNQPMKHQRKLKEAIKQTK